MISNIACGIVLSSWRSIQVKNGETRGSLASELFMESWVAVRRIAAREDFDFIKFGELKQRSGRLNYRIYYICCRGCWSLNGFRRLITNGFDVA